MMSTTQQDKPAGKPRRRGRKAERQGQKHDQGSLEEQGLQERGLQEQALQEQGLEETGIQEMGLAAQGVRLDRANEDETGPPAVATDVVAPGETTPAEFASTKASVSADVPLIGEVAPAVAPTMDPAAPAENAPIGMQTIANAYRSYAHKSLQQTGSLAEKLMGARSVDKVIEAQTEFTRQACANLVTESRNIGELYGRLASQTFKTWQRLAMGTRSK
jgi:hypothetical protein